MRSTFVKAGQTADTVCPECGGRGSIAAARAATLFAERCPVRVDAAYFAELRAAREMLGKQIAQIDLILGAAQNQGEVKSGRREEKREKF